MNKEKLGRLKQKYDIMRHHAWAGSVLLAVLVAVRGFLELSDIIIDDRIIILLGIILIIYILAAVFFTYKYRAGLTAEQQSIQINVSSSDKTEKEKLKIEKKKAKAELKKTKKSDKE